MARHLLPLHDRPDGSIWETRAGSLAGPVVADATGGNQGYAQLVCLIGDFDRQAPTAAAQESLMRMLIFLADRYDIDTDPAATTTFVSRGSDKFRAGTTITTATISGHRDVTYTACPGASRLRAVAGVAQPGARHPPPAQRPGSDETGRAPRRPPALTVLPGPVPTRTVGVLLGPVPARTVRGGWLVGPS